MLSRLFTKGPSCSERSRKSGTNAKQILVAKSACFKDTTAQPALSRSAMLRSKLTPTRGWPMLTAKQDVRALLDHLPDDSTIEDIQCHLYVLEKIRRGRVDIRDGRHLTHEQAK
jgi:hypothetical protein